MARRSAIPSLEPKYLAWVALATTGSDPRLDFVLEIALCVTTWTIDLDEQTAIHLVIEQPGNQWRARLDENPTVKAMHAHSGLTKDVAHNGISVLNAKDALVQTLNRYGSPQDFMLAGDDRSRRFLHATWPHLDDWFRYPTFDVGTLGRAMRIAGRPELTDIPEARSKKKRPRVMDDVKSNLIEARHYLSLLSTLEEE